MIKNTTNAWQTELQDAVDHLRSADPILKQVTYEAPLPSLLPHKNYYQELVESIISQQLSVTAAAAIVARFKALFGPDFPSPQALLDTDVETLRTVGLSRQKASYMHDIATKVLSGEVHFDHLDTLSNDEVIAELTAIKGVGVWTVHMFLMFCMGRLDILPVGDLGIRNGIQKLYDLPDRPTEDQVQAIASEHGWHPYESVASWYVWYSLKNKPDL